ncbi:MAG: sugar ABC transporter ATP-binding protein [Alphaproteobacteria bacterium]
MAILETISIQKQFGSVIALSDVSFSVCSGEVHVLLGENGAGKSTLMKILTGIYKEDAGNITIDDKKMNFKKAQDAQNVGISIIHQELSSFPHLTVAENIFINREKTLLGKMVVDEHAQNQLAQKILDHLHIQVSPQEKMEDLTVGTRQMIEIARAVSSGARFIIMDEPTSALADGEVEELFKVIHELKEQRVGIIYISHRLEELQHIADTVSVLRDGALVFTSPWKDTHIDELITHMVGREIEDIYPKRDITKTDEVILEAINITVPNKVNNASFSLYKGEILGFAGLMGAGRTELMHAIFGAEDLTQGHIILNGKKLIFKNPRQAIDAGIGYLTEDRRGNGLMLDKDITFNSILPSFKKFSHLNIVDEGKSLKSTEKYIKELRTKTPSASTPIMNLSGGNQQKVIIARWLIEGANILIFDEPTRGIDVNARREIYQLMEEILKQGASIILISSDLPEVLSLSDRIAVMAEGEIAKILDAKDASQETIMQYATE